MDVDPEENEEPSVLAPMGEGRNPRKELMGWSNRTVWGDLLISDIGLDIPRNKWKKNPKDHILRKSLIEIGETSNRQIPVFISESDNRPDQTDGALFVHSNKRDKEEKEEND